MYYLKLAWGNIRKNKPTYIPFLGSMIFLVILNLLMQIIVGNDGIQALPDADTVHTIFSLGNVIIMFFSIIFAFYTNSFLIKSRQRELGLYNVLGMGKKAIGFMLFIENCLSMVLTMSTGLILGGIFSKYLFLVLKKMTGLGEEFVFQLTPEMSFTTVAFTIGLFLLLFLYNAFKLMKTDPIELLHGSEAGEKEPKAHWILSIISFACLGIGYYLSSTVESPVEGIRTFFIATVLVIIGTYLFMITASVTILKFLRKRASIYYRPKAFVNISGMIYRMRQNGTGLASICILSTMVLVTISSTAGLFVGLEEGVRDRNPVDIKLTTQVSEENIDDSVVALAKQNNLTVDGTFDLEGASNFPIVTQSEGTFVPASEQDFLDQNQNPNEMNLAEIELITLDDYHLATGNNEKLQTDEVMIFVRSGELSSDSISIGGKSFTVDKELDTLPFSSKVEGTMNHYIFIMKDEQTIQQVIDGVNKEINDQDNTMTKATFGSIFMSNFSGADEDRLNFTKELSSYVDRLNKEASTQQLPNQNLNYISLSSIDEDRASTQALNGGFLFIGIVFSLSFIIATALIIYYKQISEGYEDAYRFEVMQKVGMSHKEVKQTIRSQILMVFLFPIALAVIHLVFAAPIIQKLLISFGFNNNELFNWVLIISVGVFCLCYLLVYMQTSKIYYRIVERKS